MNWMKKVAVALVCLLPLGLQASEGRYFASEKSFDE